MLSLCAGLFVVILSFPLGLAFFSYETGGGLTKQVGFVPSLSWSVSLIFLFPGAIFTGLRTVRHLRRAAMGLNRRKMLVHEDWTPATAADADTLLADVWRISAPFGLFLMAVVLAVGVWDFKTVVLDPLLSGQLPVQPGEADFTYELDWSVAALLGEYSTGAVPGRAVNIAFSALAYGLILSEIAILLSFFGLLIGLSAVLFRITADETDGLLLVPDPASADRRRGFEVFENFFKGVLTVSIFTYAACYFMRLQNLFLRDAEYARIDQILFGYIAGEFQDQMTLPGDIKSLLMKISDFSRDMTGAIFTTGDLADTQSYMGAGMILIGVLLVVLSLFAVLRSVAEDGRETVLETLASGEKTPAIEALFAMDAPAITRALSKKEMDEWPLTWPGLNLFLAYLLLGVVCFFFYRLAFFWLAFQIWGLLRRWPKIQQAN